jgi:hypothetical protein
MFVMKTERKLKQIILPNNSYLVGGFNPSEKY